uniref:Uncharacterized protein n=1 Tax=Oryza punctata TaxID=4537 RepID=A0A0E0LCQ1_ORYPU
MVLMEQRALPASPRHTPPSPALAIHETPLEEHAAEAASIAGGEDQDRELSIRGLAAHQLRREDGN